MSQTGSADRAGHLSSFQTFMAFLQEPDTAAPVLSPRRFGEALGIDVQTIAKQAGVHRNTLSRAPGSAGVQDFLREALRVIKAASDLSGDMGKAVFWYRNEPLSVFGYKTAERLVADGRADDVLRYIASLDSGAAG